MASKSQMSGGYTGSVSISATSIISEGCSESEKENLE
jgi:hypothetical protein